MLLTRQICTNEKFIFTKMKNPCHEYTIRNGGSTALRNELLTMLTLLTIFTLLTLPTQLQSERAIMPIKATLPFGLWSK